MNLALRMKRRTGIALIARIRSSVSGALARVIEFSPCSISLHSRSCIALFARSKRRFS